MNGLLSESGDAVKPGPCLTIEGATGVRPPAMFSDGLHAKVDHSKFPRGAHCAGIGGWCRSRELNPDTLTGAGT